MADEPQIADGPPKKYPPDPRDDTQRIENRFLTQDPYLGSSLAQQNVIPPVANSVYLGMQYYWAYRQSIEAQKRLQQQQQLIHQHQIEAQTVAAAAAAALAASVSSTTSPSPHHMCVPQALSHSQHPHFLMHPHPHHQQLLQTSAQQQHHQLQYHHHQMIQNNSDNNNTHHSQHLHRNHHRHHHRTASPSSSLGLRSSSPATSSTASTANLASSSSCSSTSSVIIAPSSNSSSSGSSSAGSSAASPVTSTTLASNHHHDRHQDSTNNNAQPNDDGQRQNQSQQQRHQHIKKPLNPFMIYMQKRRPEIVKQGIIKESAAINQMLGQQWRKLTKEEQEPYYKLAEQEKILHAQKYPGWSARDNYANQKKKKKLKLKSISLNGLDQSDKKCRARFGLTNMASWCKPCKRKKKCIYSRPDSIKAEHSHHLHLNLNHHHNHAYLNHHHHHHSVNNIID